MIVDCLPVHNDEREATTVLKPTASSDLHRQLTSVTACSSNSSSGSSSPNHSFSTTMSGTSSDSEEEDDLILVDSSSTADMDDKVSGTAVSGSGDNHFDVLDNPIVVAKLQEFYNTIRYRDFLCKFDPWLLVPSGSFLDLFDWVDAKQRVGPWTNTAKVYFACILYFTAVLGVYIFGTSASPVRAMMVEIDALQYPPAFSGWWCYNVVAFGWMCYIIHNIIYNTPVSGFAWVTYTVQSWTFLTIRHALCIIAPFSKTAVYLSELLRFTCGIQPALTFTVWNFIIFPLAYFVIMKTDEHKTIFYNISTCFPMMNLHVLNIVLCICNVVYSSPPRTLNIVDFYIAFVLMVLYMAWYFLVLDRIGFHLYKDYSPRSHPLVILTTWTATIAAYVLWYYVIREVISPASSTTFLFAKHQEL